MCKASFEHGVAQRITHHASSQLVDPFSVSTSSLGACPIIFETIRTYFPLAMDYNQPPANSSADTTSKSIPPIALCNFRTSDGWKISTPYKIHPECGVTVRQPSNRASRTLVRVPTPQCPSYARKHASCVAQERAVFAYAATVYAPAPVSNTCTPQPESQESEIHAASTAFLGRETCVEMKMLACAEVCQPGMESRQPQPPTPARLSQYRYSQDSSQASARRRIQQITDIDWTPVGRAGLVMDESRSEVVVYGANVPRVQVRRDDGVVLFPDLRVWVA
ncbi:predicted protein [Plenodomus lingam JN3]|uniref:Predicted protein n=1 Tax=Leptosphaeria maculans (strain JN3 / isolate v23.1.3 / race Av1-4-5-6-7-8) TaxID=985895 RepID=E4ZV32_LEPMJ|nr:predicted protein [Plenodomus lingam JN3]CBX95458.1 predicted protein [Plenodomus lingam JN3]